MKTQKGQILIITLLVLTVIAIVTVSLVSLVNRDVQQVASTEQYEDAYNTSETQLKAVLDVYGKPGVELDTIVTTFSSTSDLNCASTGQDIYDCSVSSNEFSDVELRTEITVEDTNEVRDFPIYKDRTFDMGLSGFLGTLDFYWDKNAAIEFEVIYLDGSGAIQSVRDVYDAGSPRIYNSLASDIPYADPNDVSGIHPFNFRDIATRDDATSVSINVSEILTLQGTPISGTPLTMKVTPRMASRFDSILLNVRGSNGVLPDQIREFTSRSYNVGGGTSTPVANIQTKVPLAAQPDSVLDSSLITNGILKNSP